MLCAGEVTIALSPALRKEHLIVPVASDLDGVFPQEFVLVQSPDRARGGRSSWCRGPCPAASHHLCSGDPAVAHNLEQRLRAPCAPPPTAMAVPTALVLLTGAPEESSPWEAGPESLHCVAAFHVQQGNCAVFGLPTAAHLSPECCQVLHAASSCSALWTGSGSHPAFDVKRCVCVKRYY